MKKHVYVTVFQQIYQELERISVGENLEEHLHNRTDLKPEDLDDRTIFKRMSAVIFSSGFNATVVKNLWPGLKEAFKDFDFREISLWGNSELEILSSNPKIIRNKTKIKAIIRNAGVFNELVKENGSFHKFLMKHPDPDDLFTEVKKRFHYLGNITTFDFLKRIGLNFIKPDIHVRRIFHRLGWLDSMKETEKNLRHIVHIAEYISQETGYNLNFIDGVFWLFCSGYKDVVKEAICGAIPKCGRCTVSHCMYRKENSEK